MRRWWHITRHLNPAARGSDTAFEFINLLEITKMKLNLKAAFSLATLALLATSAQAVLPHEVTCANGKTVLVPDSGSDAEACLTIGSQPAKGRAAAGPTTTRAWPAKWYVPEASRYRALAEKYRPRDMTTAKLIDTYMKLPPSRRDAFKAENPAVPASIWDYGPYAVCFYASVAGGADVVEAGDECHEDWVD
jgi:hypothetical protein